MKFSLPSFTYPCRNRKPHHALTPQNNNNNNNYLSNISKSRSTRHPCTAHYNPAVCCRTRQHPQQNPRISLPILATGSLVSTPHTLTDTLRIVNTYRRTRDTSTTHSTTIARSPGKFEKKKKIRTLPDKRERERDRTPARRVAADRRRGSALVHGPRRTGGRWRERERELCVCLCAPTPSAASASPECVCVDVCLHAPECGEREGVVADERYDMLHRCEASMMARFDAQLSAPGGRGI